MPQVSLSRVYASGEILLELDLDAFLDDLEELFNVTKIDDNNIQNAGINAAVALVAESITANELATASIGTTQIVNQAITKEKLHVSCAGAGLQQNVDGSLEVVVDDETIEITADVLNVADHSITNAKLAADASYSESTSASGPTTSSTTFTVLCSTTVVSTGRPIMVLINNEDLYLSGGTLGGYSSDTVNDWGEFKVERGSTEIDRFVLSGNATNFVNIPNSSILITDHPAAGTYTYYLYYRAVSGGFVSAGNSTIQVGEA